MGIAANKFDLFNQQEVKEEEGRKFAEEIGAVFQSTSAKESVGIDGLFHDIGEKIQYYIYLIEYLNQKIKLWYKDMR